MIRSITLLGLSLTLFSGSALASAVVVEVLPPTTVDALIVTANTEPAANEQAFRAIFADIRARRFAAARSALAANPQSPLASVAQAELWLAKGSGLPNAAALSGWLAAHADLPQAASLQKVAARMALKNLPPLPAARPLYGIGGSSARLRSATQSSAGLSLAARVKPLIQQDRSADAEALFRATTATLDPAERAEWAQQIAWSYLINGQNTAAMRLGAEAAGGVGDWAVMGDWVRGLAAFRSGDCATASQSFQRVGSNSRDGDSRSAGHYWAARAATACGDPRRAILSLRAAASAGDSFYGLLAARALGIRKPGPDEANADWATLRSLPVAMRVKALVAIGEKDLAGQELRHAAEIGDPRNHRALIQIAAALDLPSTQIWLARHLPSGVTPDGRAGYPTPDWQPTRGWRVDRSLVFAHALQESRFVTDAVSHAGARGLMQVMPGTARLVANRVSADLAVDRLNDPAVNIEFGQSYLEQLRDSPWTGGLLPKVIAAYNAGPGALRKWKEAGRDTADPLLFIETIPFWETRHYVEQVLRNYWIYARNAGDEPASLNAMAQGLWPRFPGQPGASSVQLSALPDGD